MNVLNVDVDHNDRTQVLMTSDGHRLRQSWSNALNDALTSFRDHLTSTQSSSWKRVPIAARENSSSGNKGQARAIFKPEGKEVSIHRKSTKAGDVYRVILDIPADEEVVDLDAWKAVLFTPELRQEWDPAVESSSTLEMFDPTTRIVKTKFTLGWPANPRDAVMISRTFTDANAIIDVSTSLPRSPDEPTYLRPSPPYVRSHVNLLAWCVQIVSVQQKSSPEEYRRRSFDNGRLRITCFWHHDLKTVWNIGMSNSIPQQLSATIYGLLDSVRKRRIKVPTLSGYGLGVDVERISFDVGRDALALDYAIVPEDPDLSHQTPVLHGMDELHARKEQRRLQRAIEVLLPLGDGWDIRISTRASSEEVAKLPWSTSACRVPDTAKVCLQVKHATLLDDHSVLKVKLTVEYSGVLKGISLNGLPHAIDDIVNRDLKSFSMSDKLLRDASSAANVSISTNTSLATIESEASSLSSPRKPPLLRTDTGISIVPRGPVFDKSILARVRRNYIYFSSLLQEPEAKWKRNTDFRGVSVTQLDSIDPTLVVYKAEATFVGIGLWDLYSAVVTPGARAYWDKLYDDATLLEDVNELSELWHYKTKPAWPVTSRDAVCLKTVYKSPQTVHVFAFSMDDAHMFPSIPPSDVNTIRVQIDLQGWAIESLSPTTTQLTLLEQSDPKGWSGKSTIPQQMISNVAGIGEFVIKYGGPPIVTRLGGAKCTSSRYDHERGVFRIEYLPSVTRQSSPTEGSEKDSKSRQSSLDETLDSLATRQSENSTSTSVECELRCDIDTWATALDIVIDPPPQSINCLRRHRLSAGGGGLWLTVGHDIALDSEERLHIIVRRAPLTAGKEKGVVMVNGKRISVDVEELPEAEVKSLSKQKRVKPTRIPLDQPPVLGVIRRRKAELASDTESGAESVDPCHSDSNRRQMSVSGISFTSSAPKIPSPLSNFFINAMEQARSTTQQAVAAFSPPVGPNVDTSFPQGKLPLHFALDALSFAQGYHRGTFSNNWSFVTDKGLPIERRMSPEISPTVPVHKGEKVIEGFTAEEVASVIFSYDCRKRWDDRFGSACVFEEYGGDCHTAFITTKGGFPFRDRGFYVSSVLAKEDKQMTSESVNAAQSPTGVPSAIYCVSASFNPDSAAQFSPTRYNPYSLPIGRTFIDAWILYTLDPYTTENFAIPSTKCIRLAAYDYMGSIPVAVNSMINSALPRSILAVEASLRKITPFPEMRTPAPGLRLDSKLMDASECAWQLSQGSTSRVLLESRLDSESKTFRGNIAVSLSDSLRTDSSVEFLVLMNEGTPESTPKANRSSLTSRATSPDTGAAQTESENLESSTRMHRGGSTASQSIIPPGSISLRSRSYDRLRASSAALTMGRDIKSQPPTDFIMAEVVVDLRTYREGYDVHIASKVENQGKLVKPIPLSVISDEFETENILPTVCSIYVLPPSPLHTSSPGAESPIRHLLRLSLPTSQFEVPSVEDPLTGETHSAPPKPQWYKDLEASDKRCLVRVQINPLPKEKERKDKVVVIVDGVEVPIAGEKEFLRSPGAKGGDMNVLSRVHVAEGLDALSLPMQLSAPVVIADTLLDRNPAEVILPARGYAHEQDDSTGTDANGDGSEKGDLSESPAPLTPMDEITPASSSEANRGLLSYFNAYQGPLSFLRIKSTSLSSGKGINLPGSLPSPSVTTPSEQRSPSSIKPATSSATSADTTTVSPLTVTCSATAPRFSLPTLIAVAIIAFLLGSLLRSLLSPADFIYVVTDLSDVPDGVTRAPGGGLGEVEPGWREIRRLVELKYILGGWDFQIAAVRRH